MIDKIVKPYTICIDLIANIISTEVFFNLLILAMLYYIIKLAKYECSLLVFTKTFFIGKFSDGSCKLYNKILVMIFISVFCLLYHVIGDYNFIILNSSLVFMLIIYFCYCGISKYILSKGDVGNLMIICIKIFTEVLYFTLCLISVVYMCKTLFLLSKTLNPFIIVSSMFN